MKKLKHICKKNWYIIVTTFLLAVTSEVLCGVMVYDRQFFNPASFSFYSGMIALRFALLLAGFFIAFSLTDVLKKKCSSLIMLALTILAFIYRENDLNIIFNYYLLCTVAVMISLAFYYVNYCTDSIVHTIIYIIEITVLCEILFNETEFYMVLLMQIFLVITNYKTIKQKTVKVINWIFTGISSSILISTFVMRLISQMEYRYMDISDAEGLMEFGYYARETAILLEKMMIATKDFGTSKFFGEFANESYAYNLAKIFGYYGNFVGVIMVMLIVAFFASVLIGCSKKQEKIKPVLGAVAIMLTVRIISAFFINFGFISILESNIPFVSLLPDGYLNVGLFIGVVFASEKENVFKRDEASYEERIQY